jgi:hypothetical protein
MLIVAIKYVRYIDYAYHSTSLAYCLSCQGPIELLLEYRWDSMKGEIEREKGEGKREKGEREV